MGITAMVVDDSVIYRKAIVRILQASDGVDEVLQASNGKEALRIYKDRPADLVTLDIEMPLMTGLETLPEILKINAGAKVLMISSLTKRGASHTMEALNLGATDFITKEQAFGLRDDQADELGENINSKLATLLKLSKAPVSSGATNPVSTHSAMTDGQAPPLFKGVEKSSSSATTFKRSSSPDRRPVSLLLVGSSTGGPQTLQEVFKQMKPKRNYATVVVQHMPPVFTAQLAMNLSKTTGHTVLEAQEGLLVKKGTIVIAKGGYHLELGKTPDGWVCHLTEAAPVNSCRPSVDVTWMAVSRTIKQPEVVAVMLTGMGADGAAGAKCLAEKRVPIITQEESSCVVYGMPKAVDQLGVTDRHAKPTFVISEVEKFMIHPEQM